MTPETAQALADAINAYHDIVRRMPPRKPGLWGFIRYFYLERHPVGSKRWSLWRLEKEIRRCGDARIHFALNCGATSCPPIRTYTADALDAQLTLATRAYLSSEQAFRLDEASGTAWLSPLFRWYRADFGDPLVFVAPYVSAEQQAALARSGASWRVRYLPWDWSIAH